MGFGEVAAGLLHSFLTNFSRNGVLNLLFTGNSF